MQSEALATGWAALDEAHLDFTSQVNQPWKKHTPQIIISLVKFFTSLVLPSNFHFSGELAGEVVASFKPSQLLSSLL